MKQNSAEQGWVSIIIIVILGGILVGITYSSFYKRFTGDNFSTKELSNSNFSLNSPLPSVSSFNSTVASTQILQPMVTPSPTSSSLQNGAVSTVQSDPIVSHDTPMPVVVIPSNWKKFVVEDIDFKYTTEMFLPPNYKYHLTYGWTFEIIYEGDEIFTNPKRGEVWETKLAVNRANDGSIYNRYDGSSRRSWYQKNVLDFEGGKITSVDELSVGNGLTFLKMIVNYPSTESSYKFETHFVYVENGFLHYVKPLGARAFEVDAQIPKVIDKIFYTMKSYPSGS